MLCARNPQPRRAWATTSCRRPPRARQPRRGDRRGAALTFDLGTPASFTRSRAVVHDDGPLLQEEPRALRVELGELLEHVHAHASAGRLPLRSVFDTSPAVLRLLHWRSSTEAASGLRPGA